MDRSWHLHHGAIKASSCVDAADSTLWVSRRRIINASVIESNEAFEENNGARGAVKRPPENMRASCTSVHISVTRF
jgi:hypothetical protein